MTTTAIRKRLIAFLADADDKKVKAIYTLLENEMDKASFMLTDMHKKILDEAREEHLAGQSESYSWDEAKKIVRAKKAS